MCKRRGFCIFALVFVLLVPCWKAESSNSNVEKNSIFVSVVSDSDQDTSKLHKLIFEIVIFELSRLGYTTYPPLAEYSAYIPGIKTDTFFEAARGEYASSLILINYTTGETTTSLRLSSFDVADKAETASVAMSSEIDLSLDMAIADSLADLLEQSGIGPPVIAKKNTGGQIAFPEQDTRDAEEPSVRTTEKSLRVSAGFAPFIALGATTNYFSIGMEPSVAVHFRFKGKLDFLEIGVLLRTTLFKAQGILLETDSYLISAAPDIKFAISPSSAFRLHLHVTGGPTGLLIAHELIGTYWKVIASAAGGGGVSFALGDVLGLTVNVDYSVYLEKSMSIMGISPAMHAVFSF